MADRHTAQPPIQRKENTTGLPDNLKSGIEHLSGYAMDDVNVHYNSSKPAQLNAHAYAQGTDIHVASGQERHLPHEAWHVVQQKQGRVQPTRQLKGKVAVNDDTGLEREADVMGEKALRQGSDHVAPPDTLSNQATSSETVQRAVGFEFETGWLVEMDTAGAAHDDVVVEPQLVPLSKKDPIGVGPYEGFKLEADEAGNGRSEIEFIVHPPIPESASNIEVLAAIMTSIEQLGEGLLSRAHGGPFTLDKVTGRPYDYLYMITPKDATLSGGPQVTSGIDLAKIPRLFSHRGSGNLAPEELKGSLSQIEDSARTISETKLGSKVSPQLLGLLTLITSYLQVGRGRMGEPHVEQYKDNPDTMHGLALNYPKRIAEPLLARTHFGKLFSLIPLEEQRYYYDHPKEWMELVIESAGGFELYNPLKPVIERGIQEDETGRQSLKLSYPGPTRAEWILGIINGVDRIVGMEDGESMGELGTKTEGVSGGGRVEAGIFEFRGAQTRKIPLSQWKKFAVDFLKYVITLHDQSLPIPIPKKKD